MLLHLTNINNGIDSLTWWLDSATAQSVPFDMIGLSYYGYWHGSLRDLQGAVTTLSARYDKDVVVLETAYPWTLLDNPTTPFANSIDTPSQLVPGYPATPTGQAAHFRAVQDVVASAPGARGRGAVYWEPAWTSVAGAGWDPRTRRRATLEDQAMFTGPAGRCRRSPTSVVCVVHSALWMRVLASPALGHPPVLPGPFAAPLGASWCRQRGAVPARAASVEV